MGNKDGYQTTTGPQKQVGGLLDMWIKPEENVNSYTVHNYTFELNNLQLE